MKKVDEERKTLIRDEERKEERKGKRKMELTTNKEIKMRIRKRKKCV